MVLLYFPGILPATCALQSKKDHRFFPVKNIAFALILLGWLRGYFLRKAGWMNIIGILKRRLGWKEFLP